MSKHILKKSKDQLVEYFKTLPAATQYKWATTPFNSKTQTARLRRLLLKEINGDNLRSLKS